MTVADLVLLWIGGALLVALFFSGLVAVRARNRWTRDDENRVRADYERSRL